jgi:hypothetical protein
MRETRAELVAHVGGKPTAVQSAMIERACQLTLRIVAMDRTFAETGAQTDHDSRTYLAWSNSLTRTLTQLGVAGATTGREPSIADLLVQPAGPSPRVAPADPETPRGEVLAPAVPE